MPSSPAYEPVLSGRASSFLVALAQAKQRQVLRLLFQLAAHPAQPADHAVRELRITEIDEL